MDDEWLAQLGASAEGHAPRPFAVYGVLKELPGVPESVEERSFIDYGLEYEEEGMAVLWSTDGTHRRASSAEQILKRHQQIGEARLTWLD